MKIPQRPFKCARITLFFLLACTFTTDRLCASPEEGIGPVEIQSDDSQMVDGIAIAIGNANLKFRGMTVSADKLEYDQKTNLVRIYDLDSDDTLQLRGILEIETFINKASKE